MEAVLGEYKLYTKLEVASFSHCINIERNPQILGAPLARATRTLSCACDFMMSLFWQTPAARQI